MNWLCQNYNKQKRGGVIFWSLFLLAMAPFVLVAPAHAADDSAVSVTVDQNAELKSAGTLYKATANVTVKTSKSFGFNLTMQADTSDLIHATDPTHKISAMPSASPADLGANQWGYALAPQATQFRKVPATGEPAAVVADVTKAKPAGCANPDDCTKQVTFAANVDPAKLASGKYYSTITYTATAKTPPHAQVVDPTVCRSGDPKNDCQVDLDANMIPVKYTGNINHAEWTSLANREDAAHQGEWYNYNQKQWANAVTVKPEALSKYRGQNKVVDQADILGYWVYIPRYAYEVMRRDGTDKPVPAQNFLIRFEKTTTPKRVPAACPEQGKDYRTECYLDRDYIKEKPSAQGTWATHPAFTFGTKELNGIWFAKFETTGTGKQPTVLPNEAHMSGKYDTSRNIGRMYTTAKTLGAVDNNNIGGKTDYTVPTQNNHHLAKLSSHMVNNNDWGAATYLSASKYGAGYNKVRINTNGTEHNYGYSYSTTGCGPQANGNTSSYSDSGTLGTPQACGNPDRAYNGTLGQLASTTNNPTGIYDMSGGGWEYVAASYSYNLNNSNTNEYFGSNAAHPPYVNTYNLKDFSYCTYQTCGGQALYETNNGGLYQWNGNYMSLIDSSNPWFNRGGGYTFGWGDGPDAGLFYVGGDAGYSYDGSSSAFRVALAPVAQD